MFIVLKAHHFFNWDFLQKLLAHVHYRKTFMIKKNQTLTFLCIHEKYYQFYLLKMQKKKIIMEANLRFSGFCGIQWFSDCLRICWIDDLFKPTTSIQHFIYIDFRIILTQSNINFSRQEHQIDSFLYVSFNASDSQVLSYTPFHFSLTVPLIRIKHVRF